MAEGAFTLLGTRGCHLCDEAETVLRQVSAVRDLSWRYIDIADDEALLAAYAERIPVLRTPAGEALCWPFSLLDVLRLCSQR